MVWLMAWMWIFIFGDISRMRRNYPPAETQNTQVNIRTLCTIDINWIGNIRMTIIADTFCSHVYDMVKNRSAPLISVDEAYILLGYVTVMEFYLNWCLNFNSKILYNLRLYIYKQFYQIPQWEICSRMLSLPKSQCFFWRKLQFSFRLSFRSRLQHRHLVHKNGS